MIKDCQRAADGHTLDARSEIKYIPLPPLLYIGSAPENLIPVRIERTPDLRQGCRCAAGPMAELQLHPQSILRPLVICLRTRMHTRTQTPRTMRAGHLCAPFFNAIVHQPLETTRINHHIRAREVRLIGESGENLGVLPLSAALQRAQVEGLDLIEISPNATPPVAKIMEYGKFQYAEQKKRREARGKSHTTETKSIQVKIGTGEHDLNLKAQKSAEWLREGHRIKVDLFLWGRYKYMEFDFLKERLERFLKLIPEEYTIAAPIAKSPKGLSAVLERGKR